MRNVIIITLLITGGLGNAYAAVDIFEGAPEAPPGYTDYKDAQKALITGTVPRFQNPQEIPESIAFHDDVVYGTHNEVELSLDIFVPKALDTPRPLMFFIHGGGWSAGKKEDYLYYCVEFAKLGYVTASVQYRLTPKHTFPANIQDVKCAIGFLRTNAEKYHIDSSSVVAIGGSAGGHLSLLAGYAQDPALDCPDAHHKEDTSVQAVVNIYGVVDCTTPVAIKAHQVINYIGKPYSEAKESYETSSPLHHLDASDPPTLTIHGTIDELVPISQADTLHTALNKLGIVNYYDRIEGWPHSMDVAQPINDRCRYVIEQFLSIHAPIAK